ncbi:hypothetical protein A7U60_g5229 [Sanghuangporus baumii]|uniref:Uncharacterized protein n=1 Tax=Sanghuangporus baumii TaxID=108892 RepID=A0A9Q5HX94_SANBA|nr:hypothetical protein A7U60_g5229 [Sanghuangporus baumii]
MRRRRQRSTVAGGYGAAAGPATAGYGAGYGNNGGRFGGRFGGGRFGGNRAAGPYAQGAAMGQAETGGPTMPEPTYGGGGDAKTGYAAPSGPPPYRQV